jgi:hypothetical protein
MNKLSFKFWVVLLVFMPGFISGVSAQPEFSETIRIETTIDPVGHLAFSNRTFNTKIKTWDKDYVELQMSVELKANKQEDINETLLAIREIEFKGSSARRFIDTKFWESVNCNSNRHKIKLMTGETVVLKKFNVENVLFIPKTISLAIESKYADIEMEDLAGEANFKIYSGKIYCGTIGGKTKLDLRYSKAFIENLPETDIKLYDSDIEVATCGNLTIESKYSKIEIENTGDIQFESYNDKFNIEQLGVVKGTAKYTEFDFGPTTNLDINFYDSDLKCTSTGKVQAKSKYSDIDVESAEEVNIDVSYDDSYSFGRVASMSVRESKYTEYALAWVAGDIALSGYEDKLRIENISGEFHHIIINNKYGDFMLNLPEEIACRLLVDMKYGNIDYPAERFERKTYIKENSSLFMDASTKNYDEKPGRLIEIKGYSNKVVIAN